MRQVLIVIAGTIVATAASAADVKFNTSLPFKLQFGKIEEIARGGSTFTTINATITNGDFYLNNADIHCEARNNGGNTWDITGKVASVSPQESKAFKLASLSGDDSGDFRNPTKIICAIKAFELGFM